MSKSLPASKPIGNNWLGNYKPPSGFYDEYLGENGAPRPQWEKISQGFSSISESSWAQRERRLERLIQDNGITYNVYSDDSANLRPWSMDMLPLVLTSEETKKIESALSQRATLLNIILSDVYGRQTLLQNSRMHPYLLYKNPSFLRSCHGILKPRDKHVHIYAADIGRAPDGNWWVLADRVEAASGLGYALENRMLMSRIFPKILLESEARSLQPFVNAFTSHIESLAPANISNPNIALLTAGPSNETYFEQSFLARNLGYTLAEGADLTVRNNRLYMKTIGGVQKVDVLLRRIDSSWADPLELRNESLIGIPGLVNAVRQGNVSIANGLGSGFVETTAMLAFLPWFCRNYLGENLEMPSVATWWCGQPREQKFVIDNIDTLVVKPTFWSHNTRSYFGPKLSSAEKEELIRHINYRPEEFCGQEIVSNATMPIVKDGKPEPRHFQLRVFLVPTENGWKMMPGGLLRYAYEERDVVVSMQQGGASKDTWALRDPSEKETKNQPTYQVNELPARRHHNDLPSRTADNLFWLGRYVERTEALARALRVLCRILLNTEEDSHKAAVPFLQQIISPGAATNLYYNEKEQTLKLPAIEKAVLKALYDEENLESLVTNFNNIERSASKVKERLSTDTWKRLITMRNLAEQSKQEEYSLFDEETLFLIDSTLEALASFIGNLMENTTRSQGWRFLEIGRRIERGIEICFMFGAAYSETTTRNEELLSRLLEWGDSSITYRRRFLNTLLDPNILEVLCFDNTNPRSLAFQTEQLRDLLLELPHSQGTQRHIIDQTALRLFSRVGLGQPDHLMQAGKKNSRLPFLLFLEEVRDDLFSLASAIEQHYFAHTQIATGQKSYQLQS